MAIRVLIADDHLPTRGLIKVILVENGFDVVAEATTGRQAAVLAEDLDPDVCLLDLNMPDMGGLEAVAAITRHHPEVKCVMLTASEDDEAMLEALRAGAMGFLEKGMDLDRLPDALRGVLRGEAAVPRKRMARVIEELRIVDPPMAGATHVVNLTDDEWRVVKSMRDSTAPSHSSGPRVRV